MLKWTISLLLIGISGFSLFSQKVIENIEPVNISDFNVSSDLIQKDDEAVVLLDVGESRFVQTPNSFNIVFTRLRRVKILSKEGYKHSEVSVPYYVDSYNTTERVREINAVTYNIEDGAIQMTRVDKSNVFDEKTNEYWNQKKFAFPNVREGSIIEYKYELETPFHFNLRDWEFQSDIPTIRSTYVVKMIPFYEYVYILQGTNRFNYQNSVVQRQNRFFGGVEFQDMVHTYTMVDLPAFKDESFITSKDDYIIKMDFQLSKITQPTGATREIITTWPKLVEDLYKYEKFGKYQKRCEKISESVAEQFSTVPEDDRAKSVIEYVKKNFTWDRYYGKYTQRRPKEVDSEKKGNSAEINLYLIGLLQNVGVSASPVIISTRDHGKIKDDYPFQQFFNYVVVLVEDGDETYLADGTDKFLAYNRIPPRAINDRGLVIKKGDVTWVDLYSKIVSSSAHTIEFDIQPDEGIASVKYSNISTEMESYQKKRKYLNESEEIQDDFEGNNLAGVTKVKTINFEDPGKPYIIAMEGSEELEFVGDNILLKPFIGLVIDENPFTQKTRGYPIDFIYPWIDSYKSIINIPEGYTISDIPEGFSKNDDLVDIQYDITKSDNQIIVTAKSEFKKSIYPPSHYQRMIYYFRNMVEKFNELIVLEKI